MQDVLDAWDWPVGAAAERAPGGLINHTWWVRGADGIALGVLQQLNTSIFRPEVHEDIEAVTAHLASRGLPTPRLVRTRAGGLFHLTGDGRCFRVLTTIGDRTVDKLLDPADAREAGALVGRFHRAVADLDWSFRMVRPGAHDTPTHLRGLREAVLVHHDHRLWPEVRELAEELDVGWRSWRGPRDLPRRVIHGDLKISNVRFVGPRALALIDLDTFARDTIDAELGDAMRSWCNPLAEDTLDARFELDLFAAAMEGYAAGAGPDGLSEAEWAAIVPGIERICVELAARFARDALEERYFGWNPRFGGRGEHNLLRARGQAALARSVRSQADAATAALSRARLRTAGSAG
ncbi:MAG: phosphotransferase [Alphaproteobacteria bacterium]|nr:phosphotransferase [Alphaproteobacteria bacterium]MCB9695613.1 phosphotransferase [Alphaproteobacteria bacterium]